jgi:hypothetical protein
MRRGFHRKQQLEGRARRRPALSSTRRERHMTADEFEGLDDQQAELWIAQRFRAFVLSGWPPDLSLMFAVHPEVESPMENAADGFLDTAA